MAGSYSHATDEVGNLRDNESFAGMIENLGDAYEMAEEMYGMIWWLADQALGDLRDLVEQARQNYRAGLEIAREANG
jgi:hypothetical protein